MEKMFHRILKAVLKPMLDDFEKSILKVIVKEIRFQMDVKEAV